MRKFKFLRNIIMIDGTVDGDLPGQTILDKRLLKIMVKL